MQATRFSLVKRDTPAEKAASETSAGEEADQRSRQGGEKLDSVDESSDMLCNTIRGSTATTHVSSACMQIQPEI
jgi:hypothetical protein